MPKQALTGYRRALPRLRKLRQERDLTAEHVASAVELSFGQLCRIERGENRVAPEDQANLATFYGIDIGELFAPVEVAALHATRVAEIPRLRALGWGQQKIARHFRCSASKTLKALLPFERVELSGNRMVLHIEKRALEGLQCPHEGCRRLVTVAAAGTCKRHSKILITCAQCGGKRRRSPSQRHYRFCRPKCWWDWRLKHAFDTVKLCGRARQTLAAVFGSEGAEYGILGFHHGREGGAPTKATAEQSAEVWRLWHENTGKDKRERLSPYGIAAEVFGERRFHRRVRRILGIA